jgi:hypothetical protein
MRRYYHRFFQLSFFGRLSQSLLVGAIVSSSLVSSTLLFSSNANAQSPQSVNPNELRSYAKAMLTMEPQRQQAFDEIKKIIGNGEVPKIVCNDNNSFSSLPNKAKDIAVNYCKRYQKVVEDNGLTINRFNLITTQVQNNEDLKRQMYNILIRLQKNPDS